MSCGPSIYLYDVDKGTIAMTNPAGSIVNKYAYDEYSNVLNQVEAVSNPFKYVGRYGVMSDDTGLLYMRARYYDYETGRFLSKDPIGYTGGFNLYRYALNNPVRLVDPRGLFQEGSQCRDCPGGEWDIDLKRGLSVALVFGWSRSIVDFKCRSSSQVCKAYVDCGSFGAQAQLSWTLASVQFQTIGTGSTVSGFDSSRSLENGYTSFGWSVSAPILGILGLSTMGNNLGVDLGPGGGISYQGCGIKYLFCRE